LNLWAKFTLLARVDQPGERSHEREKSSPKIYDSLMCSTTAMPMCVEKLVLVRVKRTVRDCSASLLGGPAGQVGGPPRKIESPGTGFRVGITETWADVPMTNGR